MLRRDPAQPGSASATATTASGPLARTTTVTRPCAPAARAALSNRQISALTRATRGASTGTGSAPSTLDRRRDEGRAARHRVSRDVREVERLLLGLSFPAKDGADEVGEPGNLVQDAGQTFVVVGTCGSASMRIAVSGWMEVMAQRAHRGVANGTGRRHVQSVTATAESRLSN